MTKRTIVTRKGNKKSETKKKEESIFTKQISSAVEKINKFSNICGTIHRNLINNTRPVSYTHLDVYKRQSLQHYLSVS